MTLFELINALPLAKLARRAALDEASGSMTVKKRKERTRRYLSFLETLLQVQPAAHRRYLLVYTPYFDSGYWEWEAALVERGDFANFALLTNGQRVLPFYNKEELLEMDPKIRAGIFGALQDLVPPSVDYTFLPWEDVLASRILFPPHLGASFYPAFLSSVIRTLAYAGFTKAQQEESRRRLVALMKARGEVKRLSREETEKRRAAIEALFPAPPAEQQKALDQAMEIETILSLEGEYKMFIHLGKRTTGER